MLHKVMAEQFDVVHNVQALYWKWSQLKAKRHDVRDLVSLLEHQTFCTVCEELRPKDQFHRVESICISNRHKSTAPRWSSEEDKELFACVAKYGFKWSLMHGRESFRLDPHRKTAPVGLNGRWRTMSTQYADRCTALQVFLKDKRCCTYCEVLNPKNQFNSRSSLCPEGMEESKKRLVVSAIAAINCCAQWRRPISR